MNIPNTILLVDDDNTTNLLNKYFAEAIDDTIDVVTTTNGNEAIEFLKNNDIDAISPCFIVLDVMMPVMDGWDFLEAYNQNFDAKFKENVTISLLTALDNAKVTKRAATIPYVNDIVEKPLSDKKFKDLIEKHYKTTILS